MLVSILHLKIQLISPRILDTEEIKYVDEADLPAYNLFNLGVSLDDGSSATSSNNAIEAYRSAIALKPDLEEALLNLGVALDRIGDSENAIQAYNKLIDLPNTSPALRASAANNIGHLKHKHSQKNPFLLNECLTWYLLAVSLLPSHVDSLYNLAKTYQELGTTDLALSTYHRVLELEPTHGESLLNLSNLHFAALEHNDSLQYSQTILNNKQLMSPITVEMAFNNRGQLFRSIDQHELALISFQNCYEYSNGNNLASLVNVWVAKRTLSDWNFDESIINTKIDGEVKERWHLINGGQSSSPILSKAQILSTAPSLLPYDSLLLPLTTPKFRKEIALLTSYIYSKNIASSLFGGRTTRKTQKTPSTAINLVYVSYDFRDHPMGHLTRGLVTGHSKNSFIVGCVSYGEDDSSEHRRSFETSSDYFIDGMPKTPASPVNPIATADALISQKPDVIIDLMSHTRGGILQIPNLAKSRDNVLINYLGYPGTSGGSYYDYVMVDKNVVAVETFTEEFTEKAVILPNGYQSNEYNVEVGVCEGDRDLERNCRKGREALFGENGASKNRSNPKIALCNFNTFDKMEEVSFTTWMNVLRRVENSMLFLLRAKDPLGTSIQSNLNLLARSLGISPNRIVFLPRAKHLAHLTRISGCNVMLDTLNYNAHTTMSDFMWAGVPSFSLKGYGRVQGSMASRVAGAFLDSVDDESQTSLKGLEDNVSVSLKTPLGQENLNDRRLKLVMNGMRKEHFDTSLIIKNIEEAYKVVHNFQNHSMHVVIRPGTKGDGLKKPTLTKLIAALHIKDEKAANIAHRFVTAWPEDSDGWHLYGLAEMQRGGLERAEAMITKAVNIETSYGPYWDNLGRVAKELNKPAESFSYFRESLNLSFNPSSAHEMLALVRGNPTDQFNAWNMICDADDTMKQLCEAESNLEFDLDAITEIGGIEEDIAQPLSELLQFRAALESDASRMVRFMKLSCLVKLTGDCRLKLGAALDSAKRGDEAYVQFFAGVTTNYAESTKRSDFKIPASARTLPIVAIYCNEYGQTWWPEWSYSSHERGGLGGSEEAVLFVSRELAKLGYTVIIYNEVMLSEEGVDPENPCVFWTHWRNYDVHDPPDVFIAWRYHLSLAVAGVGAPDHPAARPRKTFLWLQDAVPTTSYSASMCDSIDGIFVLSKFHTLILPSRCISKGVVTPNGIDIEKYFATGSLGDGENLSQILAYGSAPNRGLERLLEMWPRIYQGLEKQHGIKPVLRVYYGFSKSFIEFGRAGHVVETSKFDGWMENMVHLLHTLPGVEYHGMVDHETLTKGYAEAGFVLYPTSYPETGCVTLMKAMSAGALPITSRYQDSTLPELTGNFDLGPQIPLSLDDEVAWRVTYIESVVDSVAKAVSGDDDVVNMRKLMIGESRERFAWSKVAQLWANEFEHNIKK
ncbi:hypothetical protein TL16_g00200 [Triparma laevis f. inornata]|uniref:protein O-GlcNAc transferase n=1 Tax=Triparma laevis f. inornata TaxID=1714386 RepID=A0A9W7DLJ5_9STRA|nr:hypothetical protein TL16_g00200 [Triparma laevis f. inornata]